jgi:hypothetical protein
MGSPSPAGASTSDPLSRARSSGVEGRASRLVHGAALVALFVGALVANVHRAGTSPIVWLDTFNDDAYVEQCLGEGSCTLTGVATSVPGRVHAVAWLELRTLLAYLGADDNAVHVLMQVLAALAVVLTFELAMRLGGPFAGVVAAYELASSMHGEGVRVAALYNSSVLPFLGAVLVLACTAVVERANSVAVTLAALVAAVMANVHVACLMAGVSVLWVSLLAPSRRLRLAALGFAVFALATFCIAPPSWLQNVASLVDRQPQPRMPGVGGAVAPSFWLRLTVVGVAAWLVSVPVRSAIWIRYRRRIQGALAVAVPMTIGSFIWPLFGMEANVKYLAHIEPASAIAACVPIGMVIHAFIRSLLGGIGAMPILRAIEATAPYALALVLPLTAPAVNDPTPTVRDLTTVADVLHREYGWDAADMIERVKSPSSVAILTALRKIGHAPGPSPRSDPDAPMTALLIAMANQELPTPLPTDWRIIHTGPRTATVLVLFGSRVDWRAFEVCMQPDEGSDRQCAPSGFVLNDTPVFALRNMPRPGLQSRGTLTIHLAVRPGTANEAIFMPRLPQTCGGYIIDEQVPGMRVASDRRHAVIAGSEGGSPTTVTLQWQLGSPECQGWSYEGLPPFMVAGDSRAVALIEPVLEKQEL